MRLFTVVSITTGLIVLTQALPAQVAFQDLTGSNPNPLLVSSLSRQLQQNLTIEGLLRHSHKLQKIADKNHHTRVFGSGGHNDTLSYIASSVLEQGYHTWLEPMVLNFTQTLHQSASVIFPPTPEPILNVRLMTFTTSTPVSGATGSLVRIGGLACDEIDQDLGGKIALVQRGECTFGAKAYWAGQAGASALLIYNTEPGSLSGTLGQDYESGAPTGGISREDGERLIRLLDEPWHPDVVLTVRLVEKREARLTYNVIAETKGGDKSNIIVIGAHSDSVAAGPGINDNGSGTAALLELAYLFRNEKPVNAVRFCWWTAEEYGLLGAKHHVDNLTKEEQKDIALYLNFDMIGSPNYYNGIYDGDGSDSPMAGPPGSAAIEKLFQDFFESKDEAHDPSEFDGRSDYGPFVAAGIPSGGLFTGAEVPKTEEQAKKYGGEAGVAYDSCYHESCDDINNLNHHAFLLHARGLAHALAVYSQSTESIDKERQAPLAQNSVDSFDLEKIWPSNTKKGTLAM
ncbi:hypothetical protein F4703DRAFT_1366302 [Phycomyces blakesleeanus]